MPLYTREQVEDMVSAGDDTPDAVSYTQHFDQSVWQTSIVSEMERTASLGENEQGGGSAYDRAVRMLERNRRERDE